MPLFPSFQVVSLPTADERKRMEQQGTPVMERVYNEKVRGGGMVTIITSVIFATSSNGISCHACPEPQSLPDASLPPDTKPLSCPLPPPTHHPTPRPPQPGSLTH